MGIFQVRPDGAAGRRGVTYNPAPTIQFKLFNGALMPPEIAGSVSLNGWIEPAE
jgi:hypothetical protein